MGGEIFNNLQFGAPFSVSKGTYVSYLSCLKYWKIMSCYLITAHSHKALLLFLMIAGGILLTFAKLSSVLGCL